MGLSYAITIPMMRRAWFLFQEQERRDRAIFSAPAMRRRLMARLRNEALTWGPAFLRTWLRSSSKVTSRTQWTLFSMDQ